MNIKLSTLTTPASFSRALSRELGLDIPMAEQSEERVMAFTLFSKPLSPDFVESILDTLDISLDNGNGVDGIEFNNCQVGDKLRLGITAYTKTLNSRLNGNPLPGLTDIEVANLFARKTAKYIDVTEGFYVSKNFTGIEVLENILRARDVPFEETSDKIFVRSPDYGYLVDQDINKIKKAMSIEDNQIRAMNAGAFKLIEEYLHNKLHIPMLVSDPMFFNRSVIDNLKDRMGFTEMSSMAFQTKAYNSLNNDDILFTTVLIDEYLNRMVEDYPSLKKEQFIDMLKKIDFDDYSFNQIPRAFSNIVDECRKPELSATRGMN